jgi:hypothetical protein
VCPLLVVLFCEWSDSVSVLCILHFSDAMESDGMGCGTVLRNSVEKRLIDGCVDGQAGSSWD